MVTNETQEQLEARGWDFTEEFIPDEPTVNNQDKTVDVSENGTIEVTPDEGFTGLGKVTVNTNVQGGGGSNWRYFDCEQVPIEGRVEILTEIQAMLIKAQSLSYNTIMSSASIGYIEEPSAIVAFGADMSIEVNVSGEFTTLGKLYETIVDMLAQAGFVEITKEQFYDINS